MVVMMLIINTLFFPHKNSIHSSNLRKFSYNLSSRIYSETNNESSALLVEVWTKGMIWDRALGYNLIPLDTIPYSKTETEGKWYHLEKPKQEYKDTDVILMDGEVAGCQNPTGHMILLDCRFEPPLGR